MLQIARLEIASQLRRGKRSGERTLARVRFVLQGKHRSPNRPVLSDEQLEQFAEDGYLLASGLIEDKIVERAETAMWLALGLSPDEPERWNEIDPRPRTLNDPDLVACYTDRAVRAVAQIASEDPAGFFVPRTVYTINAFPVSGTWHWRTPHIDHANEDARHRTFPRAFRVAAMTYLSDVDTDGGGTVIWPGAHRAMEALARSSPRKFFLRSTLNQHVDPANFGPAVALTPKRGDILFYHDLMVHASSTNLSDRARLAINHKW